MLLKDILTEVDLLVDNALSIEHKIRFINQIQKQIFREVGVEKASHFFITVPGEGRYELPLNCRADTIIQVFSAGKERPKKGDDEQNNGPWYTVVNNLLLLHPIPDGRFDSYIYYRPVPRELTENDMNQSPDLPADFHEILIVGCARKVANTVKVYDVAKEMERQFIILRQEAKLALSPKPKKVRIRRGWM